MQYFSARRRANIIYKMVVTPLSAMYRSAFTVTTQQPDHIVIVKFGDLHFARLTSWIHILAQKCLNMIFLT